MKDGVSKDELDEEQVNTVLTSSMHTDLPVQLQSDCLGAGAQAGNSFFMTQTAHVGVVYSDYFVPWPYPAIRECWFPHQAADSVSQDAVVLFPQREAQRAANLGQSHLKLLQRKQDSVTCM